MTKKMVYVAGAISAGDILTSLENLRKGIDLSVDVLIAGYIPFCPFIDFQFFLNPKGRDITLEQIQSYSLEWLKKCDCVLLVPGWENSKGTQKELEVAEELGLPVYNTLRDLTVATNLDILY